MLDELVALEQEALRLQNSGDLRTAAKIYKQIIQKNPNYEFGMCFYQLACCQEDLGKFEEARINYLRAIEYNREDDIRLGGYASFLYLHGDPKEAFGAYLGLFKLEKSQGRKADEIMQVLLTLGEKIGLTSQGTMSIINKI